MKHWVVWGLLWVPMGAWAQYKCVIEGKTLYAERPCGPNARPVVIPDTSVSEERRRQADEVARREKILSLEIELQNAKDQIKIERQSARVKSDQDAKKQRCANLLRIAKNAKDEANMYRYHQGLIDDARRRQKEAEDAHFSECYGR